MINFTLNGEPVSVQADGATPLLWVLRENLELTGTKYGCGVAQCGACTVHLDGQAVRSCILPISSLEGRQVTTVEGLMQSDMGRALESAWVEEQVAQCGYCQSGQLMTAAVLLKSAKGPLSREEVLEGMAGNLCRCGTYNQIAAAVVGAQKATAPEAT